MNSLELLGWNDFFEKNIYTSDKDNFIIARIIAEHKNVFIVKTPDTELRATISGNLFYNASARSDIPVVGDWVLLKKDISQIGIIQKLISRKTKLSRTSPNDRNDRKTFIGNEQIIASNIDIVFIMTSLNQNFNLSRIERLLTLVYTSGASPIILLSKSDLCDDLYEKLNQVEQIAFGVPIIKFSNITSDGIYNIKSIIEPGKTYCLLGSSGVGKTTLMNILCNRNEKTLEIREKDSHGRHSTTSRSLYFLENGGMIIDTPGIREIGLFDSSETELEQSYSEIEDLARNCKFSNCSHTNEPGCAIQAAINDGVIDSRRLKNYLKMQTEIMFQTDKSSAIKNKKEKTKKIAKLIKEMKL